jgi:rifampicin phosphotransferase
MFRVISTRFAISLCLTVVLAATAAAQMSRKPSSARATVSATAPGNSKNSIPAVKSRAAFDTIARVYHKNTPYAMPHVLFVVDRKNANKVYFVNSNRFRFHKDFLLATYLVPRGSDVFKPIYIDQSRRFIVGTIAWQQAVEKFTWELWEGDLASKELIKAADTAINKAFFEKVYYKPNSSRQEDETVSIGIDRILQEELNRNQAYLALNTGKGVGRIHIIDKLDDTVEIGDNEIVVLKELPITLPPVRGIIVTKPSSPLSHINILAKGWNIPNVYIKNADKLFRDLNERWVTLEANLTDYNIERVTQGSQVPPPPDQQVPPSDLTTKKLTPLGEMRKADSARFGAKAANLGEMIRARIPGISIPDGFSVPFHWYERFMREHGFDKKIETLMDESNEFVHNPRVRRRELEKFRAEIEAAKFDAELREQVIRQWKTQLGGKPVFVRSSSNAEDLPNFSGAGLYSSVANVVEEEKLINGIKRVWASLWKFEAYEARVRNYVSQTDVYMSALIQLGVNMDRGGVMITKDPFDDNNRNAVYISAVCGHNSNVVNNAGLPEQVLFNRASNSVVVMTLSQQESALTFDEGGDLKASVDKCAGANKRVLNDAQVRSLARAAANIKRVFGNKAHQDIEWGIMGGKIYVVQSRPYIDG